VQCHLLPDGARKWCLFGLCPCFLLLVI
jgi:hypothetical protein